MGRILSIDFGKKRTGIAVTDPLQIIANGLTTVATSELFRFSQNIRRTRKRRTYSDRSSIAIKWAT